MANDDVVPFETYGGTGGGAAGGTAGGGGGTENKNQRVKSTLNTPAKHTPGNTHFSCHSLLTAHHNSSLNVSSFLTMLLLF